MKSPTARVGRIDDDGILNGSTTNERSRNTASSTGKNDFAYSTQTGSRAPSGRFGARNTRSASHAAPDTTVTRKRSRAKFIAIGSHSDGFGARLAPAGPAGAPLSHAAPASLAARLEHGEERLLRDLNAPDGLHPLLAGLLLLEKLLLARGVAPVALGGHVLAQRLDRLARDHLRSDRSLHGDVEHLARDQRAQLRRNLAAAVGGDRTVHHHRQRVDTLAVDQDVELDDVGRAKLAELVVERS